MKTLAATTQFAALLILLLAGLRTADAQTVTVALSGDTAPGTSDNFTGFGNPILNNAGQTVFKGSLNNGSRTDEGFWSDGGGNGLALVARMGDVAPGNSDTFSYIPASGLLYNPTLVFNDAGQTAFNAYYARFDLGIWSEGAGNGLALVAREGGVAPGTSNNFNNIGTVVLNNAGQTAFLGSFHTSTGADGGIWSEGGGSGLALVTRLGDMAPGTSDTFSNFSSPIINDMGQIAFRGSLNSSTGTNRGIWSEGGGSGLALIARLGDVAPGTSDNFSSGFHPPLLNNAGQTAFLGSLNSSTTTDLGIWSEGGGSGLTLVARAGEVAPGTSDNFTRFVSPTLNDVGQMAFQGRLNSNSNSHGIWSEGGGSGLALVARAGEVAPGTSDTFSHLGFPVFNDAGQTAFSGGLRDSAYTSPMASGRRIRRAF